MKNLPSKLHEVATPLTDYGKFHRSEASYFQVYPTSVQEAAEILRSAYKKRIPLRLRGGGHSMNGFSVPKKSELLIRTDKLNYFEIVEGNKIRAGAGVCPWDLHIMLHRYSRALIVGNDGWAGPTIGGFISAGGIGFNAEFFGGFWETVLEVTLITPCGEILQIKRHDPLFPWLFGSMGQFGLIVEALLWIGGEATDEKNSSKTAALLEKGIVPHILSPEKKYSWYTLFAPLQLEDKAQNFLNTFAEKWSYVWEPEQNYRYHFTFRSFNPPLLYPAQESFVAVGVWGKTKNEEGDFEFDKLAQMNDELQAFVLSDRKLRRYIQTEHIDHPIDYKLYFGDEIYSQFLAFKQKYDPERLLNQHTVFPP